jgi:hypothetical protein
MPIKTLQVSNGISYLVYQQFKIETEYEKLTRLTPIHSPAKPSGIKKPRFALSKAGFYLRSYENYLVIDCSIFPSNRFRICG